MRWYAEGKNNKQYLLIFPLVFAASLLFNLLIVHHTAAQTAGAGTTVGVTLCAPVGSTITLNTPVSDSVVTDTTVQISGNVVQASQIEVRIDDAFDSIIPLSMGQETFDSSVQVSAGTHTIKVTAVNVCAGPSGTAASVITYTPPPQNPSTGSEVPTTAGEGVTVGGAQVENPSGDGGIIDRTRGVLKDIAKWLNIRIDEGSDTNLSAMSVGQAVALTLGLLLAIIGIARPLLQFIAGIPGITHIIPGDTVERRVRNLSFSSRSIGVLLILGSLFL